MGLAALMVFFIFMSDRLELVIEILTSSFKPSYYNDVSMQLRLEHWQESFAAFNTFPLFGHLTWMVILLFNVSLFARKPDTSFQPAF